MTLRSQIGRNDGQIIWNEAAFVFPSGNYGQSNSHKKLPVTQQGKQLICDKYAPLL